MRYQVKCIFCGKTWLSKEPNFLTFCGCCKKTITEQFEAEFIKKPLKPKIRVENK